jgi:hypothetical protein
LVHDQPFVHWVNRIPELSLCPKCIPDVSWLLDAEQFLRHAVDCQISHESRVLKRCAKMRHLIDCQDGHKVSTFAQVRSCNSASFRTVDQLVTEQAIAVATCDPKCYQLFVENPHQYPFQDRIFVNELKGHVQDFDSHSLRVRLDEALPIETEEVKLVQRQCHFDLKTVFQHLTKYWVQFWQADRAVDNFCQLELDATLAAIPPLATMQERPDLDVNEWQKAINSTKTFSSPGIDGFTFAKLKQIPKKLLSELVQVVAQMEAFPEWLWLSKTIPLPKVQNNPLRSQSRPITVLSTIYRIWSKITARGILRHLASQLPPEITGLLPGRGAFQAAYHQQVFLEKARLEMQTLTGLTLDLKKCVNLIGRDQVQILVQKHGLNPQLIDKWANSLKVLSRYWL